MKHRERVQAALSHEVPDRCPMQVCFTPEFASMLRTLRRKGGLIIDPTHHVQLDIPMENLQAMVRAIWNTPLRRAPWIADSLRR